jgi:hypothetical protein
MAAHCRGLSRLTKLAAFALLLFPAWAHAQDSDTPAPANQSQRPPEKKTEKEPPPPLFSRHRRGAYTNALGVELVDATPQSPPLETDDPGVPDKGEYEINLTTDADLSKQLRTLDFFLIDANYGTLPKLFGHELPTQLKLEFPLAAAKAPGQAINVGLGAARLGLKLNFYNNESQGVYISFYPQIEFAVPGSHPAEKSLAEPGQTLFLPLLVQKEFKHFTFVSNGIINQPIHDAARDTTGTLAWAFGRALTRRTAAMAEIRFTSSLDFQRERLLVVNAGLMRRMGDNVVLYGNIGRSVFSDQLMPHGADTRHIYAGAGVKFLRMPNHPADKK